MNRRVNDRLISQIIKNIPSEIKVIDYLKETLKISRESLYRRVRGEIPFTFDEISRLSVELDFSIDEIVRPNNINRVYFALPAEHSENPSKSFCKMLENHYDFVQTLLNSKDVEITIALNYVWPIFTLFFDPLFKFSYYRWMHFNREDSPRYKYSDVHIPQEIIAIKDKIKFTSPYVHNTVFITDQFIYLNLIKDILYYYERKLISDDELLEIKNGVADYFKLFQEQITMTHPVFKVYNYVSAISFGVNCSYIRFDDNVRCHFHTLSVSNILIDNPSLCESNKDWLDSLRKYATMITESNEIFQAEFMNTQYKYLEMLDIS